MQYLTQPSDRATILDEGRSLGRTFGERSLVNQLTLTESASAFLYFQDFLVDGVTKMSKTGGQNINIDMLGTCQHINHFTSEILIAMLQIYERE